MRTKVALSVTRLVMWVYCLAVMLAVTYGLDALLVFFFHQRWMTFYEAISIGLMGAGLVTVDGWSKKMISIALWDLLLERSARNTQR